VCREKEPSGEKIDAMLVNKIVLSNAIETEVNEESGDKLIFVETEPLLSAYCRAELLQTLGKLAVSGATPEVVRGVGADIHRLITVTATAMKSGYGILLEDFLPEFAAQTVDPHTQSEEGQEADQ
jgi:hypothetical protein